MNIEVPPKIRLRSLKSKYGQLFRKASLLLSPILSSCLPPHCHLHNTRAEFRAFHQCNSETTVFFHRLSAPPVIRLAPSRAAGEDEEGHASSTRRGCDTSAAAAGLFSSLPAWLTSQWIFLITSSLVRCSQELLWLREMKNIDILSLS